MKLSPDETIFWQHGFFTINLTIVTTWAIMLLLVVAASIDYTKTQNRHPYLTLAMYLEMLVTTINNQIEEIGLKNPKDYIGFIGTPVPVYREYPIF
jgi:F-type H+-transporting ATPase subunit a